MARKEKKYHFIYKTTNTITNKYYVGMHSTNNLDDGYLGSGRRIRYSINKYGSEVHTREILEYCKSRDELSKRESELVTESELKRKECLNLIRGGSGVYIHTHTDKTKERMRKAHIGKVMSNEARIKMRNNNLGKTYSAETNKKKGRTGILNAMYGKPRPDVTKQKLREVNGYCVYQYDMTGTFIREWDSMNHASIELGVRVDCISGCASNKYGFKSAGGYLWSFTKYDTVSYKSKLTKKCVQYDMNMNLISEYKSHSDASRSTNISRSLITMACNGNRKTAGGYIWKSQ